MSPLRTSPARDFYLNLPVADLPAAKGFFTKLGFEFEPRFTNDTAACMIISERAHVMLLQRPFFETFTPRSICDTSTAIEGLFALSSESREAVDALVGAALAAGAREAREPTDRGFMYARSFFDPDGHQWEVLWMDEAAAGGAA
jgi:predicted lactoylglutathione lyase